MTTRKISPPFYKDNGYMMCAYKGEAYHMFMDLRDRDYRDTYPYSLLTGTRFITDKGKIIVGPDIMSEIRSYMLLSANNDFNQMPRGNRRPKTLFEGELDSRYLLSYKCKPVKRPTADTLWITKANKRDRSYWERSTVV